MMVTMPGLPMFGHGQIEGFAEKYGMEYRYAKWNEQPDWDFVRRHEREIFPLIKRRHLYAGVENFLLYDFFAPEGHVNENVFAYSNRAGDERALVIYHNKYESARGWVRTSVAYSLKKGEGDERTLAQKDLGEGLGLHADGAYFCMFRDHVTGLEYIRNSKELCEKGLYVELGAYKYHVFTDFWEVRDNQWQHYAQIASYLNGRGTPNVEETLKEIFLQPVQNAFKGLVNKEIIRRLMTARLTKPESKLDPAFLNEIEQKIVNLLHEVKTFSGGSEDEMAIARELRGKLETILRLPAMASSYVWTIRQEGETVAEYFQGKLTDSPFIWGTLLSWLLTHPLGKVVTQKDVAEQSRSWIDEWRLGKIIATLFMELGLEESVAWKSVTSIKVLTGHQQWFEDRSAYQALESLLKDNDVQQFLRVNRYNEILWFNKESFEELRWWLLLVAVVQISSDPLRSPSDVVKEIEGYYSILQRWQHAEKRSGYQVEKLLEAVKE